MLYNTNEKRVKKDSDCLTCKFFDKKTKICKGLGIVCIPKKEVKKI